MDKIHAMQLFIKVADWKVFPARQISLLCQREVFRADTGTGTSTWHPASPAHHAAVKLTPEGMTYYQRAKDVLSNSTNWTVCFNRMPPVSAVNYDRHPARNREKPVTAASVGISYLHPGIELELSSHDRPVDILTMVLIA